MSGEIEYLVSTEFDLDPIGRRLPAPLHAGRVEKWAGARAFYDTFDGRLRGRRMRLVQEDGLLRLAGPDGRELGTVGAVAAEWLRPGELAPGPMRDRLSDLCGLRALLRTGEIESRRRMLPVLDEDDKTVARIVLEQSLPTAGTGSGDALRPRLRLTGVRGYDKHLRRLRRLLEEELGLAAAPETLEDELAARGTAAAASAGLGTALTPDLPADRAAVALCTRLLRTIEANLPGTLGDLDTEFLHDFRVAVRRTRSLLRELKTVFPPDDLKHFRQEFRWLQRVTGPSRDLDVYLLEFADFAAAVPEAHRRNLDLLRTLLEEHQSAARGDMEDALRSERTSALLASWPEFLERLPASAPDGRPDAVTPIAELAARRIDHVYRQMVRMGKAIDDESPHEALHDLRKKGKELRYLLEFFAPLFPGKVTKPMVKTLKALQDTLGRFQDREVQAAMIRGLGPEVGDRPGGPDALMAMGVLVERLAAQQDAARAEFHERFAAFSAREQRKLVKRTFR